MRKKRIARPCEHSSCKSFKQYRVYEDINFEGESAGVFAYDKPSDCNGCGKHKEQPSGERP